MSQDDRRLFKEQQKAEGAKALAEYRAREDAVNRNTERLRALRLAHEAANPPPAPAAKPKAKKRAIVKSFPS